jgi:hypothetical protein
MLRQNYFLLRQSFMLLEKLSPGFGISKYVKTDVFISTESHIQMADGFTHEFSREIQVGQHLTAAPLSL